MAALTQTRSHASSHSLPAGSWVTDDAEDFIQEDESVPAANDQSEADSDDVLEALIQSELAQFHEQQAQRYAALASEGHTYIPLASPAPQQQQLRAQQRQQEALTDPVSFEEQERIEYVPSARSTMDMDQLGLQHSSGLQCFASQHSMQEQQQQPLQPSNLGPELTDCPAALEEGSTVQADTAASARSSDENPDAVDPASRAPEDLAALPAGLQVTVIEDADSDCLGPNAYSSTDGWQPISSTVLEAGLECSESEAQVQAGQLWLPAQAAADDKASPTATAAVCQTGQADYPAGKRCADHPADAAACCIQQCEPSPRQLQQQQQPGDHAWLAQGQCSIDGEQQQGQAAAVVLPAATQELLQLEPVGVGTCCEQGLSDSAQPEPYTSDSAAACPQGPYQDSAQRMLSAEQHQQSAPEAHGVVQQQEASEQQQHLLSQEGQQQSHTEPHAAGSVDPDSTSSLERAQPSTTAAAEAVDAADAASAAEPTLVATDVATQQPLQVGAVPSTTTTTAAVAAAFSSMSLGACSTAELSPWEVYTDNDDSRAGSKQQSPLNSARQSRAAAEALQSPLNSARQSRECSGSGGRASNASAASNSSRLSSPRQQQQQQSPRHYQQGSQHLRVSDSSQGGPMPLQPPHSVQQQQRQQQRPGLSPTSSTRQGLSYGYVRPSSAPVGSSRGAASIQQAAAGLAAYDLLQQQQQVRGSPAGNLGNLGVVVESSQEGLGPASVGHRQQYTPGRHANPGTGGQHQFSAAVAAADFAAGMHSQQETDEQRYQHHILAHMAQLQLQPRPASAEPWGRSPQWGGQYQHGTTQQQGQHRIAPSWDDSPMPLNIPRWVPIAQATLLPSTSTACSSAAGAAAGVGTSVGGIASILAGGRSMWPAAGGSREASRPQTAGPVMTHSQASCHSWAVLPQQQRQEHMGCLTARSASSSPNRRRAALLPTPSTAAAAALAAGGGLSGGRASSGALHAAAAKAQQHSSSSAGASASFSTGYASAYLSDVQQKIRSANSYCKQLGLNTQYRLAQGSSRKDKWQLEQIEVEVWVLQASSCQQATQQHALESSSQQQQQQQQQQQLQQHTSCSSVSTSAAAGDGCEWQLRRSISLAQFTHHLNRLRAGTAGAAAAAGSSAHRSCMSAGSTLGSSCRATASAGAGFTSKGRAFSPDRVAASNLTAAASAPRQRAVSSGRACGNGRACSSGSAQLLVLSPRNSEGLDPVQCVQHLMRPASAPRGSSRLSPRRQRD